MNTANLITLITAMLCVIPTLYLLISPRTKYDTGSFLDSFILLCGLGAWILIIGLLLNQYIHIYTNNIFLNGNISNWEIIHTSVNILLGIIYLRFIRFMISKTKYKANENSKQRGMICKL